jgi:hypothetical protein
MRSVIKASVFIGKQYIHDMALFSWNLIIHYDTSSLLYDNYDTDIIIMTF